MKSKKDLGGLEQLLLSLADKPTEDEKKKAKKKVMKELEGKTPNDIGRELPLRCPSNDRGKKLHKIVDIYDLPYIISIAVTRWTAIEQITGTGDGDIQGYNSYQGLASFLSGKRKTAKSAGEYFIELAKENKMPILTEEHQAYVDNFNLDYIKKVDTKRLKLEIPIRSGYSISKNTKQYSYFLHELSKKICKNKNKEMQYEFFKKWTGITKISPSYPSLTALASFLTGKPMDIEQSRTYFRSLLK